MVCLFALIYNQWYIVTYLSHIVTLLHRCIVTLLHCYIVASLHCYIVALLHCCIVKLLHYYIVVLLHCCIVTLLHCYIVPLLHCSRMDIDQAARRNAQDHLGVIDPDFYTFEGKIEIIIIPIC